MASWRDLVMQQSGMIAQNARRNPGLENLGKLIDMSMSSKMRDKEQATKERMNETQRQHEINILAAGQGIVTGQGATPGQGTLTGQGATPEQGMPPVGSEGQDQISEGDFSVLNQIANKNRAIAEQESLASEKEGKIKDMERLQRFTKDINSNIRATKSIDEYSTIKRGASNIEAAYQMAIDPNTKDKNAADQALVVSFNKMLDPGSVVRESEFARTPDGQALISRVEGRIKAIKSGGVGLTDQNRKELLLMSRQLLEGAKKHASKAMVPFQNQAEEFGIPFNLLQYNELIMSEFSNPQEADDSGLPKGTVVLVGGRRYEI